MSVWKILGRRLQDIVAVPGDKPEAGVGPHRAPDLKAPRTPRMDHVRKLMDSQLNFKRSSIESDWFLAHGHTIGECDRSGRGQSGRFRRRRDGRMSVEPKYYRTWHLAKSDFEYKTTEFEWSLIRFYEAFSRFVTTTGMLTISGDIKFSEHVILHVIRMQDRPKNSATIARLINRDDIPNVQYSLRKLESAGLIKKLRDKTSNQYTYTVTDLGAKLTDEYHSVRAEILISRLQEIQNASEKLETLGRFLSMLTGIYEEAARDSATISPSFESE